MIEYQLDVCGYGSDVVTTQDVSNLESVFSTSHGSIIITRQNGDNDEFDLEHDNDSECFIVPKSAIEWAKGG